MEKPAQTDYPILALLKRRWSPRAFSDRMIEPEKLLSLFEAARWAPSSFNEQPWCFMLVTREQPEDYARLVSCLTEGNQQWARQAPALIVSAAKLNFDDRGKTNRHAFYDVGMAVGNLMIQATALDLFVHQMAGFSVEKVAALYGMPEEFAPIAVIALGYGPGGDDLPKTVREAESKTRSRKRIQSFVFQGQWGQPSPLISG